ncbi:MAG: hypothetical protein ACK5NG_03780, partial [Chthoniobacterales bacterium]
YAPALPSMESTNSLGFLASLPLSAQGGTNKSELCTVGYFSGFGKSSVFNSSTQKSGNIYRYFVASDETFEEMTNTSPDFFKNAPSDSGDVSPTGDGLDVLARNIADFSVRQYTVSTDGSLNVFTQSAITPMPDLIEVSITAVNNEFANKIGAASQSEWKAETDLSKPAARQNRRTFTVRIPINRPN